MPWFARHCFRPVVGGCTRLRLAPPHSCVSQAQLKFSNEAAAATESASDGQTTTHKVKKEHLQQLRKATGYSFVNCRKALEKFGDDLTGAEQWLHDLAKEQGWEKATKLSGKTARQGLIAVLAHRNVGCMVELNCQTDFVASGTEFRQLAARLAHGALTLAENASTFASVNDTGSILKIDTGVLTRSKSDLHGSLADELAFYTGKLGEKLVFTRSVGLSADASNARVFGYAHPKGAECNGVLLGQFGTLVSLYDCSDEQSDRLYTPSCTRVGLDVGLHIVGMNPERIGTAPNRDESESETETADDEHSAEQQLDEHVSTSSSLFRSDENELLKQQFMVDPNISVHEYLERNQLMCKEFYRFEIGAD